MHGKNQLLLMGKPSFQKYTFSFRQNMQCITYRKSWGGRGVWRHVDIPPVPDPVSEYSTKNASASQWATAQLAAAPVTAESVYSSAATSDAQSVYTSAEQSASWWAGALSAYSSVSALAAQ